MRILLSFAVAIISMTGVSVHAQQPGNADELAKLLKSQPRDLVEFAERAEGCQHWAGEAGEGDEARRKEIHNAVIGLRCNDLEDDKKALADKYKNDGMANRAIGLIEKTYME